MQGIKLSDQKRKHLLEVYLSEGYRAAVLVARQYGVTDKYPSELARENGYLLAEMNAEKVAAAQEIIRVMAGEMMIGRHDLFRSKFPHCLKARRAVILRLKQTGMSQGLIAKACGLDEATVRYWTKPGYREKEIARRTPKPKTAEEKRWDRAISVGAVAI